MHLHLHIYQGHTNINIPLHYIYDQRNLIIIINFYLFSNFLIEQFV